VDDVFVPHTRNLRSGFFLKRGIVVVPRPLPVFPGFLNYEKLLVRRGAADCFLSRMERNQVCLMCFHVPGKTTAVPRAYLLSPRRLLHSFSRRTPGEWGSVWPDPTTTILPMVADVSRNAFGQSDWPRPLRGTKQVFARGRHPGRRKLLKSDGAGKSDRLCGSAHSPGPGLLMESKRSRAVLETFPRISRVFLRRIRASLERIRRPRPPFGIDIKGNLWNDRNERR